MEGNSGGSPGAGNIKVVVRCAELRSLTSSQKLIDGSRGSADVGP